MYHTFYLITYPWYIILPDRPDDLETPSAPNHPKFCRHLDTYEYRICTNFGRFTTRFALKKSNCVKEVSYTVCGHLLFLLPPWAYFMHLMSLWPISYIPFCCRLPQLWGYVGLVVLPFCHLHRDLFPWLVSIYSVASRHVPWSQSIIFICCVSSLHSCQHWSFLPRIQGWREEIWEMSHV